MVQEQLTKAPSTFQLSSRFQNNHGVNPSRGIGIPAKCVAIIDNKPTRIAYDPSEQTIFFDEMHTNVEWKDYNPTKISFNDLMMHLGESDWLLEEYMRASCWNENNINKNGSTNVVPKYKEIIREAIIEETPAERALRYRAGAVASGLTEQKRMALVEVLQGTEVAPRVTMNFMSLGGVYQPDSVLDNMICKFAEDYPEKFFEYYEDKSFDYLHTLKLAVKEGVLKVNVHGRNIVYTATGTAIPKSKCPTGMDPLAYFAENIDNDTTFQEHYDNICHLLDGGEVVVTETPEDIFEKAKEAGVLTYSKMKWSLDGTELGLTKKVIMESISGNLKVEVEGNEVDFRDYLIKRTRIATS